MYSESVTCCTLKENENSSATVCPAAQLAHRDCYFIRVLLTNTQNWSVLQKVERCISHEKKSKYINKRTTKRPQMYQTTPYLKQRTKLFPLTSFKLFLVLLSKCILPEALKDWDAALEICREL